MGAAMGDQERMRIDSELYVNEATLELLRRRIESEVKVSFFRSIGLPVGGAGVAAVAFALFFWIPQKVQTFVESDPSVQAALQQSAQGYLTSKEGQEFVRGQIEDTARKQVEAEVVEYFTGEGGQELVRAQVEAFVQKDPMIRKRLQQSAQRYLASKTVEQLIIETVNRALAPATAGLSQEIRRNKERLVSEVAQLPALRRIAKGPPELLDQFLDSPGARELETKKVPVALTISIRQGRFYVGGAIRNYLRRLKERFGDYFKIVLILDNDDSFLALLTPEQLERALDGRLMSVFNAGAGQLSTGEARRALARRFGRNCVTSVRLEWRVEEALRASVWSPGNNVDEVLAVVDTNKRVIGTTSRRRLITGILG
jgi:hypothetical protein